MSLKNSSAKNKIPRLLKDHLNDRKINQVYKSFEKSLDTNKNFVVAVSGGPDSLALAFLAKIYSLKKGLSPKYLIVDHKLRPESTKEAKLVKHLLKSFLIKGEILTWRGKKPSKNIQSVARKKRFELIFKTCEKYKIKNILLGHHLDDLFENFFIRLTRGSGLKGLVSLDIKSMIDSKNLLRHLLYQNKKDLEYISSQVFGFYVQDPSNKEDKYQRTKIRKLIEDLKKNGLDKKKFINSINNLKFSNKVINFYVNKNFKENTYFLKKTNQLILNNEFFQQPDEIIFRSLSDSLKLVGKKFYSVRGKKLDKIIRDIKKDEIFKQTLGGCIIEKVNQTVIIKKEE